MEAMTEATAGDLAEIIASAAAGEDIDAFDLVLVGEGGYEGLAFIARATWRENGFDVHGYIVETGAP
jgi:hypothetical protein